MEFTKIDTFFLLTNHDIVYTKQYFKFIYFQLSA